MLNSKPSSLIPSQPKIILPKNKYGITEQKFKSNYGLTRKEYENFTTYMLYYLDSMVAYHDSMDEFKVALTYANESHTMSMLPENEDYLDESMFAQWFTACSQAQQDLENSIDETFIKHYNRNIILDTEQNGTVIEEIRNALTSFAFETPTLDSMFKSSSKEGQTQRVLQHYNSSDAENSADFILWQGIKGILAYNKNTRNMSTADETQLEDIALKLASNFTQTQTAYGMKELIGLLPHMWH